MAHSSQSTANILDLNVSTQDSASDVEVIWPVARWCEMALCISKVKSSRAQRSLIVSFSGSCVFEGGTVKLLILRYSSGNRRDQSLSQ